MRVHTPHALKTENGVAQCVGVACKAPVYTRAPGGLAPTTLSQPLERPARTRGDPQHRPRGRSWTRDEDGTRTPCRMCANHADVSPHLDRARRGPFARQWRWHAGRGRSAALVARRHPPAHATLSLSPTREELELLRRAAPCGAHHDQLRLRESLAASSRLLPPDCSSGTEAVAVHVAPDSNLLST